MKDLKKNLRKLIKDLDEKVDEWDFMDSYADEFPYEQQGEVIEILEFAIKRLKKIERKL